MQVLHRASKGASGFLEAPFFVSAGCTLLQLPAVTFTAIANPMSKRLAS